MAREPPASRALTRAGLKRRLRLRGGRTVTRYLPARQYMYAGMAALAFGAFAAWYGFTSWRPAYAVAGLFVASAGALLALAFRPAIEIHEKCLVIGRRRIPWVDIRRVDGTGWMSPLIVQITLSGRGRVLLVYPGDLDSANSLLRHLRRSAREATIDGVPYRQFHGEPALRPAEARPLPSPKYRLLRPEDEAEVELLYQRLKSVRHLDPDSSTDET